MVCSLTQDELFDYVRAQTQHFFPDRYRLDGNDVRIAYQTALDRLENCFKVISVRGYYDSEGNTLFSHLHADQYAAFLYLFANTLWNQSQNSRICDKLMQLNRVLFSFFISYKCNLPEFFFLGHPVGSVLGNAFYSNYLVVLQGVTVNTAADVTGHPLTDAQGRPMPVLGKGLFLGAGATILGSQPIGDRVSIGANAMIYNQKIPDDSIVISQAGGIQIRHRKRAVCKAQACFNVPI